MTPPSAPATARRSSAPPAIWTAFASQGRWKNWVMASQLFLLAFMSLLLFAMAHTRPDVVVVTETGESKYLAQGAAAEHLQRFLDEERQRPSDVTLLAFVKRFALATSAPNSATIDEAWTEALSMMAAPLATQMAAEAQSQKLLETYRLAQVRTAVVFDTVQVVERRGEKAHVRLELSRTRAPLFGVAGTQTQTQTDRQQVDLVLVEVPRSAKHPDGLEVLTWQTQTLTPDAGTP